MRYHNKYVEPCFSMALKLFAVLANIAALCTIVGAVLEFGFDLSEQLIGELNLVYFWTWMMFLIERIGHLLLTKRGQRKSAYSFLGWTINGLLVLTLIPIIIEFFGIDDSIGVMRIVGNRVFHLLILFLIATIELSDSVITSLGRKSNPALMMAVSFLFIIMVGSGMLLMPRCIQPGVHLSWIDSLFTATSAVCVTGLTTIDVSSTFTSFGQLVIIMLIQVGGLGVMTITSFFALFFMGNTSIYNQMQVQDMVSSKSLASLWSTLLNIFGFTAFLELAGAVIIFLNIHGTIGLDIRDELFFSVFHAVSAFCNAGFSNYQEGVGAAVLMEGHCWLYITLALLIILGGIGYPVLVNMKIARAALRQPEHSKPVRPEHEDCAANHDGIDCARHGAHRIFRVGQHVCRYADTRKTGAGVFQCRQSSYGRIHQREPEQHVHTVYLHLYHTDVDRRCVAVDGWWREGQRLCRSHPQHPLHPSWHHTRGICRTRTVHRLHPSC